jgi:hypothetical protein
VGEEMCTSWKGREINRIGIVYVMERKEWEGCTCTDCVQRKVAKGRGYKLYTGKGKNRNGIGSCVHCEKKETE